MNGVGKTTTLRELKRHVDIDLPVMDIEHYSYFKRNCLKIIKVLTVILNDIPFSFYLYRIIRDRFESPWIAFKNFYNINHRAYFYLYDGNNKTVLGGGLIHKIWVVYGFSEIMDNDKADILKVLKHFNCKKAYVLNSSKQIVKERNTNRGKNTRLENRLNELDTLYEFFQRFIECIQNDIEICFIESEELSERVSFLLEECDRHYRVINLEYNKAM